MYTFILVCSLSNLLLNEHDDDDDDDELSRPMPVGNAEFDQFRSLVQHAWVCLIVTLGLGETAVELLAVKVSRAIIGLAKRQKKKLHGAGGCRGGYRTAMGWVELHWFYLF